MIYWLFKNGMYSKIMNNSKTKMNINSKIFYLLFLCNRTIESLTTTDSSSSAEVENTKKQKSKILNFGLLLIIEYF